MNRTLKFATAILILLAIGLAVALTLLSPEPPTSGSVPAAGDSAAAVTDPVLSTIDGKYPSSLVGSESADIPGQLPASLDGTEVPTGWNRTDANGSLVPTPQLRQLFEHYLAALGEETLAQLIARIEKTLEVLPEPARSEAVAILGGYLDYKLELGELEASSSGTATMDPDTMAGKFSEIRSLRRQWLDAQTAEAFFVMDEAVDDFQLAQMRIRADESLTDQQREKQLRDAEQQLPPPIREAREQTRKFSDYQQMRQQLRGNPESLQAWREEAFGSEVARRLAQVEADQQAWDERWQAYQREKAGLEQLGLAGPEQVEAVNRLREQFFDGPERYRAEALDSIQ